MPEHDETCAHRWITNDGLSCYDCGVALDERGRPADDRRKPKAERWRVEDKVVDSETK